MSCAGSELRGAELRQAKLRRTELPQVVVTVTVVLYVEGAGLVSLRENKRYLALTFCSFIYLAIALTMEQAPKYRTQ